MNMVIIFQLAYVLALSAMVVQRYHLLMTLLSLEGMMLILVLIIPYSLYSTNMINIPVFALIMLTLGACEASVGLSILVNMSRSYGTDMFSAVSSNKC